VGVFSGGSFVRVIGSVRSGVCGRLCCRVV